MALDPVQPLMATQFWPQTVNKALEEIIDKRNAQGRWYFTFDEINYLCTHADLAGVARAERDGSPANRIGVRICMTLYRMAKDAKAAGITAEEMWRRHNLACRREADHREQIREEYEAMRKRASSSERRAAAKKAVGL